MTDVYKNFSGRDFTARYESLLTRLRTELPELTDLNHADPGISLLRLLSREIDQLGFYLDEAFGEGFILSARFMQSLIDIAATTDYPPKLASAASTTLDCERITGVTGDIAIPQYSVFSRSDGQEYILMEAAIILASETEINVDLIQGERQEIILTPANWTIGEVTKRPRYNLGQHVVAGSVSVENQGLSLTWTEVDSFWRSKSTDKHFLLRLYADKYNGLTNTIFLELGDGTQGEALPAQDVTVSFLVCNGPDGNTGIDTIITPPTELTELITVSNPIIASGGAYAEAKEAFRKRIPKVTRTQRRGVITEDYEALVGSISGVLHVQALDRNNVPGTLSETLWGKTTTRSLYGYPYEYIVLVIVPEGGGAISPVLKDEVWNECKAWGHLQSWSGRYILTDAIETSINVSMRIGVKQGYNEESVRATVVAAIQDLLAPENQEIGGTVTFTELYSAATAVTGISWVQLDSPTADTVMSDGHFAVPGTITVTVQ